MSDEDHEYYVDCMEDKDWMYCAECGYVELNIKLACAECHEEE